MRSSRIPLRFMRAAPATFVIPLLKPEAIAGRLWIVDEQRIRLRSSSGPLWSVCRLTRRRPTAASLAD